MNDNIIDQFKLLVEQLKYDLDNSNSNDTLKNSFRLDSIKKTLKIIENFKQKINSSDQLKDIKGIGKGSIKRIDEILKTGKLSEIKVSKNKDKFLKSIDDLTQAFGIGRKKAIEIISDYNISSLDELIKLIQSKKIELPENILKGIKYAKKTTLNIPRQEIDQIYNYIVSKSIEVDIKLNAIICGSYRRLKKTSNDIDVILYHEDIKTKEKLEKTKHLKNFIELLSKDKFILESYTSSDVPTKFMGVCKFKKNPIRRIDIRLFSTTSLPYAILYFTGSGNFNKKMRAIAINQGYKLNEYGLYDKNNKFIKLNSEKEIFEKLNMEYVPPDLRL